MCLKSNAIYVIFLLTLISIERISSKRLLGVTVEVAPYLYVQDNKFHGYCVDVMDEISRITNLNYSLYVAPDGQHGAVSNTPPVSGMMFEIYNNMTDFGIADLTVTDNRKRFVDFTEPIMELGISALLHNTNAELIDYLYRNLVKQSRIQYGMVRRSQLFQNFHDISQQAADETVRQMYLKMTTKNWLVGSKEDGIQRAKLDTYAFIQESANNEFIAAHDCDLTSIRDYSEHFKQEYAIALPKGSPYLSKFNFAIRQMDRNGFFDKLKAKHWKSYCNSGQILYSSLFLISLSTLLSIKSTW